MAHPAWALVALALLAPVVAAGPGALAVTSAAPVLLDGDLVVEAPGGQLLANGPDMTGTVEVAVVSGTLTLASWRSASATLPLPGSNVTVQDEVGRPTVEVLAFDAGSAEVAWAHEEFRLRLVADADALIRVSGEAAGQGLPARLVRPQSTAPAGGGVELPNSPPSVELAWEEGWEVAGTTGPLATGDAAFPAPGSRTFSVSGPARFQVEGGNLTFRDAEGRLRTVRLGEWKEDAVNPFVLVGRRAIFDGTLAVEAGPLGSRWGLAAPDVAWRLDGEVSFRAADAEGAADGPVAARDASVLARGAFTIDPDPPAVGGAAPVRYDVSGRFDRLVVGGVAVVAAPASPAAGGLVLAAVAAALALGAHLALLLYARIARSALLDHPRRRAMLDLVRERPGLHLRDLQRGVALSWGAFAFHLRALTGGGYLRIARVGRYRCVFPTVPAGAGPVIPHPVARKVYDALPGGGDPVDVATVAAAVGVSHQLARYHLRALAREGHVRIVDGERGPMRAGRSGAAP